MPKEWKLAQKEATRKPDPNELIRKAGYDTEFFDFVASYHLKVAGAKLRDGNIQIKLQGASGNSFPRPIILPVLDGSVEVSQLLYGRAVREAHAVIAANNPHDSVRNPIALRRLEA